ncbi:hypothetical protein VM1G_01527 [Cytospora mali]|uniref:SDP1 cyclo-dipeptide biosynthesis cluster protein VmS7 n=1 Tax=Cytospora mali TaxID=578113 RepID=VMS7_CYTMA|nr:hypothetical protein VM1G_01527 [Valsa mali]
MADSAPQTEYIGTRLAVFVAFFTPLQLVMVILRFVARRLTARPRGLDDFLVIACLLSQFIATGIAIGALKNGGVGYHAEWLTVYHPYLVTSFLKYLMAIATWYFLTCGLGKLAICVFYRTLFPQRSVLIILCITSGIIICTAIATSVANLAACTPFSASWGSSEEQAAGCFDKEKLYIWASFPNIITDVILLVLPLPITWKLNTTKRLKVALTFTFLIGSIGLISSVLRFVSFSSNNSFIDPTWHAVELIIWTIAEPGIYLVAACLMTYRPLVDRFGTKIRGKTIQRPSKSGASLQTIGSKRTGIRDPKSVSHTSTHHPADDYELSPSTDRGVLLSSLRARGDGFEQLPDPEDSPSHVSSKSIETSNGGIVKTINIRMSWDKAGQ